MARAQSARKCTISVSQAPSSHCSLTPRRRYDITVTHNDLEYMQRHYETQYRPELNAKSQGEDDDESFEFAEKNFRPLYYIKEYEENREKIEMSFDLTQ